MSNSNYEDNNMRLIKKKREEKPTSKLPSKYNQYFETIPPLTTIDPPIRYIVHLKVHKNKSE